MERAVTPLDKPLGLKPVYLPRVMELKESGTDALALDCVDDLTDGEPVPWSPMLLVAQYAAQRGLLNYGRPDVHKAGIEILERVLEGRIPYAVHPPASFTPADPILLGST